MRRRYSLFHAPDFEALLIVAEGGPKFILNATDAVGLTPLDQAALDGQDEMTRLLLDRGARITLPAAIALGRADDVERLIREDPDALSTTNNRPWARLLVHAAGRLGHRGGE